MIILLGFGKSAKKLRLGFAIDGFDVTPLRFSEVWIVFNYCITTQFIETLQTEGN